MGVKIKWTDSCIALRQTLASRWIANKAFALYLYI